MKMEESVPKHRLIKFRRREIPAYEDGIDKVLRNVGIYNSDAGEFPPMKMEQCSETSAYKIQKPGNYPEESIQLIRLLT
jgi:hypothetical protein